MTYKMSHTSMTSSDSTKKKLRNSSHIIQEEKIKKLIPSYYYQVESVEKYHNFN